MTSVVDSKLDSTVELELALRDSGCFFVGVSAAESCHLSLEHLVRRSDGRILEFFAVSDADPGEILALAGREPAIDRARVAQDGPGGTVFEFLVSGPCVTTTLADLDAVTRSVSATRGEGRVVATVPSRVPVREVVEAVRDRHGETTLRARRTHDHPVPIRTGHGARAALADRLTEKQLEVLRTAFTNGYFDWPRGSNAEECAESLGIAQPTFSQHIRTAQQAVFAALFDDDPVDRPHGSDEP